MAPHPYIIFFAHDADADGYASFAGAEGGVPIYLDGLNCSAEVAAPPRRVPFGDSALPITTAYANASAPYAPRWGLDGCSSLTYAGDRVSPPQVRKEASAPRRTRCLHTDDAVISCGVPLSSFEFRFAPNATAGARAGGGSGLVLARPLPNLPWGTLDATSFMWPDPADHIYMYGLSGPEERRRLLRRHEATVRENLILMCKALGYPNPSAPRYLSFPPLPEAPLASDYSGSPAETLVPTGFYNAAIGAPDWAPKGIKGPRYALGFACTAADGDIRLCAPRSVAASAGSAVYVGALPGGLHTNSQQPLGLACGDREMPQRVELVRGTSPSAGQVAAYFAGDAVPYYIPRRLLDGAAPESVTLFLRTLCGLAGFASAIAPAVADFFGERPPNGHRPMEWDRLPTCDERDSAGGGGSIVCFPAPTNRSRRGTRYGAPWLLRPEGSVGLGAGGSDDDDDDDARRPLGVDCLAFALPWASEPSGVVQRATWDVRLVDSPAAAAAANEPPPNASALSRGLVQLRVRRRGMAGLNVSWGYVYATAEVEAEHEEPLWDALCAALGFPQQTSVSDRILNVSAFSHMPHDEELLPIALGHLACPPPLGPPLNFSASPSFPSPPPSSVFDSNGCVAYPPIAGGAGYPSSPEALAYRYDRHRPRRPLAIDCLANDAAGPFPLPSAAEAIGVAPVAVAMPSVGRPAVQLAGFFNFSAGASNNSGVGGRRYGVCTADTNALRLLCRTAGHSAAVQSVHVQSVRWVPTTGFASGGGRSAESEGEAMHAMFFLPRAH